MYNKAVQGKRRNVVTENEESSLTNMWHLFRYHDESCVDLTEVQKPNFIDLSKFAYQILNCSLHLLQIYNPCSTILSFLE